MSGIPKSQGPANRQLFAWLRGYPDELAALGVEVAGYQTDEAGPIIGIQNLNRRTASPAESPFQQANPGATGRIQRMQYGIAL